MKKTQASHITVLLAFTSATYLACSGDGGNSKSSEADTTPIIDTSGGGIATPAGGEDLPAEVSSGAVQDRVCSRIVPEDVLPSINCTPKSVGPDYDACSEANTACGSVIGCTVERNEAIEDTVDVTYSGPVEGFQPPATLLPAMGTYMDGMGTGWFARNDGTRAGGSCSFPPMRNIMAAALSVRNFSSDWCGACAEVVGNGGQRVRVQIVDECAACEDFSLDLGAGADSPYTMLETKENYDVCQPYGGQPLRWRVVPCETVGGVVIHYVPDFDKWTPAIQIRNHRLPIAKLEDQVDGVWMEVERQPHNWYYIRGTSDSTAHPIVLRITAIDGSTIEGTFPPYAEDMDYETNAQF